MGPGCGDSGTTSSRVWGARGRLPAPMANYCELCDVSCDNWEEHCRGRKHRARKAAEDNIVALEQEMDRVDLEKQRSEEARLAKMRLEESKSESDSEKEELELQRKEVEDFCDWRFHDAEAEARMLDEEARLNVIRERENRLWDLANRNPRGLTWEEKQESIRALAIFQARNARRDAKTKEYYEKVNKDLKRWRAEAKREARNARINTKAGTGGPPQPSSETGGPPQAACSSLPAASSAGECQSSSSQSGATRPAAKGTPAAPPVYQ